MPHAANLSSGNIRYMVQSTDKIPSGIQKSFFSSTCCLFLEIFSGFKVYASKAVVGPLDRLNCVIGPNGIGKSVLVSLELLHCSSSHQKNQFPSFIIFILLLQGEALAFALGANARMLRVKSISGVISSCPDEDGILPQAAQVSRLLVLFIYSLINNS